MKIILRNILCMVISYLFFLGLQSPIAYCSEHMVQIPQAQYQQLKSNNDLLTLKLETLQLTLENLKTPSVELAKQLTECRTDLQKANKLLSTTQEKLIISQQSLKSAEALLNQTELSLKILEQQITDLKRKYKRERTYGWLVAGMLGTILIVHK